MAEIITRDSEEFKELAGWIKKSGESGGRGYGTDTPDSCGRALHDGG